MYVTTNVSLKLWMGRAALGENSELRVGLYLLPQIPASCPQSGQQNHNYAAHYAVQTDHSLWI